MEGVGTKATRPPLKIGNRAHSTILCKYTVLPFHEDWRKPVASVVERKVSCPFCLSEEGNTLRSIIRSNGRTEFLARYRPVPSFLPSFPPPNVKFSKKERTWRRSFYFSTEYIRSSFGSSAEWMRFQCPVSISISTNGLTSRGEERRVKKRGIREKRGGELEREPRSWTRRLFRLVGPSVLCEEETYHHLF